MPCRDSAVLHLLCLQGQATVTPWDGACGMEKVSPQQHFRASSYTEIMRVAFPIGSALPRVPAVPNGRAGSVLALDLNFPWGSQQASPNTVICLCVLGFVPQRATPTEQTGSISEIMNGLRDGGALEPAKHPRQQTKCHATHGDAWHALQARDKECQWGVCWQASAL